MKLKDYRISLLADYYGEMLSERAMQAVRYCYDDDMSLSEAAELMCVTRQAVGETLAKATAKLEEYENKLGLYTLHEAARKEIDASLAALERGDVNAAKTAIIALKEFF